MFRHLFTIPLALQADNEPSRSLFTATQEQLGLKLESAKAPVPVLVVGRVAMPTPD